MGAPVVIGALLAWQQGYAFSWELFALTLLGALSAHLGANVLNDVFDFGSGTDQAAQEIIPQGQTAVTGSRFLLNNQVSMASYRWLAAVCFAVALLCGVLLSIFRPLALAFGAAGFLLAFFYVAPPLRLAYIGRGLGELDILISFGMLPLVGSYYVQSGAVTWTAILASLPIGLYTMSVLYFHHFLHWRADKIVGKITPVVALGERGARVAGSLTLLLIALAFILDAILPVYPWYSVVAALTILPAQFLLRRSTSDLKFYLQLMSTNFKANLQAALLVTLALLIRGFVHI
jgi:1,4-dihydroxy-2-naphthoate octaprenyltransferase